MFVYVWCLCEFVCTTCVPGASGGQGVLDSLELELVVEA